MSMSGEFALMRDILRSALLLVNENIRRWPLFGIGHL